jgi:uncharacterized membrane protein YkoI
MRIAIISLVAIVGATTVGAQEYNAHEKTEGEEAAKSAPALAAAMKEAKVSLSGGLKASASEGLPLSGKFELEDGKLQLSVYTTKGGTFFEVIVDHKTGKVVKTEALTGAEDLVAARKQAEVMAKTKRSLREVVMKAEKANAGFTAVSVSPELESGAAQADIELLKGTQSRRVEEKL